MARSLVLGPDGAFWFAGGQFYTGNQVVLGRMTTTGRVREFALPVPTPAPAGAPYGTAITNGPEGAFWFAGSSEGRSVVGRLGRDGSITTFPLPQPAPIPNAIAGGPDGNLWFTEGETDQIGRASPTGTITLFPLPDGSRPTGIAAGDDGALWFTEPGTNRIGRISTDGIVSEIPLSPAAAVPNQIARGIEGDLWFTELATRGSSFPNPGSSAEIGRVSTDGDVRIYPVAGRYGGTGLIAAAPSGRLWFTTGGGENPEVGWIEPDGRSGLPTCGGACGYAKTGLAFGPEGRLWFSLDQPYNGGGGGSGLLELKLPGRIARYRPPPLALGTGLAPVRGGRTSILAECTTPERCEGTVSIRLGHGSYRLGAGRFDLARGDQGTVALVLTPAARRRLRTEGKVLVSVSARSFGREIGYRYARLER